jgi:hypothetical protein
MSLAENPWVVYCSALQTPITMAPFGQIPPGGELEYNGYQVRFKGQVQNVSLEGALRLRWFVPKEEAIPVAPPEVNKGAKSKMVVESSESRNVREIDFKAAPQTAASSTEPSKMAVVQDHGDVGSLKGVRAKASAASDFKDPVATVGSGGVSAPVTVSARVSGTGDGSSDQGNVVGTVTGGSTTRKVIASDDGVEVPVSRQFKVRAKGANHVEEGLPPANNGTLGKPTTNIRVDGTNTQWDVNRPQESRVAELIGMAIVNPEKYSRVLAMESDGVRTRVLQATGAAQAAPAVVSGDGDLPVEVKSTRKLSPAKQKSQLG